MASGKKRLDLLLVERGLADTVDKARCLIGVGAVLVNDHLADKAGYLVPQDAQVRLRQKAGKPKKSRYVSRGGDKLETALAAFRLRADNLVCADIGASTGGFTDCLLQHGAARVYCVDVGYGILAWKLRCDPRVLVRERVNARYLSKEHIPEPIHLAVMDASFISATQLLPPLFPLFSGEMRALILVKPQFQLGRGQVAKGGVVRNPELRAEAVHMVREFAESCGLNCAPPFACPVNGAKGNEEFFLYLTGRPVRQCEGMTGTGEEK